MIECKLCGSAVEELATVGNFDLFICRECMTVQRDVPDTGEYMKLYDSGAYYLDLQSSGKGYDETSRFEHDIAVNEVRVKNILAINAMDKRPNCGSVLDVGSSNGALCQVMIDHGHDPVTGVDPDPHAVEFALKAVPGASFKVGTIRSVCDDTHHSVITFIDSLEHDLDPVGCLAIAKDMLSRGGIVVVETPDCECEDFKKMGVKWRHVKPAEHPFLFSTTSLVRMLRSVGLSVVDVRYTIPGRVTVSARKAG